MKTVSNEYFNRSFLLGAMPGCVAMSVSRENYIICVRWSQQDLRRIHTFSSSLLTSTLCDRNRSCDLRSAVKLTMVLATALQHSTLTRNCATAASKRLTICHNQNALSPPPTGNISDWNFSQDTLYNSMPSESNCSAVFPSAFVHCEARVWGRSTFEYCWNNGIKQEICISNKALEEACQAALTADDNIQRILSDSAARYGVWFVLLLHSFYFGRTLLLERTVCQNKLWKFNVDKSLPGSLQQAEGYISLI